MCPSTCMYAVQNFENSRSTAAGACGNNNRGKRTPAESAVVQSTLKHQTVRYRIPREKHWPPNIDDSMHLHAFSTLSSCSAVTRPAFYDFVFATMRAAKITSIAHARDITRNIHRSRNLICTASVPCRILKWQYATEYVSTCYTLAHRQTRSYAKRISDSL